MAGRYWVIAPYEATDPGIFDKVWQFDLNNGFITIGWGELGDISSWDKNQIRTAYEERWGNTSPSNIVSLVVNMLWKFFHEISEGDIIIARRGTKKLAAVGMVKGGAYFSQSGHPEIPHHDHFYSLDVQWYDDPRDKEFDSIVFQRITLSDISEDEYQRLIGAKGASEVEENEERPGDRQQFYMEKYLEEFIVGNFDYIFGGDLTIEWKDKEGNSIGQQYATPVGRIDILAFQNNTNSFMVIELKKGRTSDEVVGQIQRYMTWVREELCSDGQGVKGMIICGEPDRNLSYSARANPYIELKYYHIHFTLE